ncbi:MAG TPA: polyamine aminopropyltransferase [Anaerolineae bacterium]|nr:polyamine aminopropyltransferase [Anaerolineae bacterium]
MSGFSRWFDDTSGVAPGEMYRVAVSGVVWSARTPYQHVLILETPLYGRVLVLDDAIQSSERDEHIYHEALVHPALIAAPDLRRVLIIGGGEGALLREVLKYRTVEKVTMIDLDEQLVRACREYLPSYPAGAFDDPRAEVIFGDGVSYLRASPETFDCIFVDVNDSEPDSISGNLYTPEFYALARARLSARGMLAAPAATPHPLHLDLLAQLAHSARQVFARLNLYVCYVPVLGSPWAFLCASSHSAARALSAAEVDRRLADRVTGPLRFYDGETHVSMFALPRYLREMLDG